MKNELQKHKKSDSFKWFCTLLAVLMLAVAVTAAITQGFKNWNPYGWFDKKEEQPLPEENGGGPVTDENGNEMNGGEVHEMPKQMAFRSVAALDGENAYDSVTLHATVKPDDAADKSVVWCVVFKDPESEWATGKTVTDYITVTPQSEGSAVATVKCLQPFGEQIKIFAVLGAYLDAFDGISLEEILVIPEALDLLGTMAVACTVDFYQRITSVSFDLTSGEKSMTVDFSSEFVTSPFSIFDNLADGNYSYTYTDFTLGSQGASTLYIGVDESVFDTARGATEDTLLSAGYVTAATGRMDSCFGDALRVFVSADEVPETDIISSVNLYSRWLSENLNSGLFYIKFECSTVASKFTKQVPVHFTAESFEIMPTEITLDDTILRI